MRANAARAMASLLGLKWEEKPTPTPFPPTSPPPEVKGPMHNPLVEAVRKELDKTPHKK